MFKLSDRSKERLNGVDERIHEIIELALTLTKVDFGIPSDGGLRSKERQKELFDQKVSKCDGYKNRSYHQTGKAFDIYAYVNGKASWGSDDITNVAAAILQAASVLGYKLEWGGLWINFVDMPHFQLSS